MKSNFVRPSVPQLSLNLMHGFFFKFYPFASPGPKVEIRQKSDAANQLGGGIRVINLTVRSLVEWAEITIISLLFIL